MGTEKSNEIVWPEVRRRTQPRASMYDIHERQIRASESGIRTFCPVRFNTTVAIVLVMLIDKGWMGICGVNKRAFSMIKINRLAARDAAQCGTRC